jgi:hypothetical protein
MPPAPTIRTRDYENVSFLGFLHARLRARDWMPYLLDMRMERAKALPGVLVASHCRAACGDKRLLGHVLKRGGEEKAFGEARK